MPKQAGISDFKMRVVGRQWVTKEHTLDDGTTEHVQKLKVTLEGVDGCKGDKLVRLVDEDHEHLYPEREVAEFSCDFRQTRMPLGKGLSKSTAAPH